MRVRARARVSLCNPAAQIEGKTRLQHRQTDKTAKLTSAARLSVPATAPGVARNASATVGGSSSGIAAGRLTTAAWKHRTGPKVLFHLPHARYRQEPLHH